MMSTKAWDEFDHENTTIADTRNVLDAVLRLTRMYDRFGYESGLTREAVIQVVILARRLETA